jgi:hypothetical protein
VQAPLYALVPGPQWEESVAAADPGDDRFADNLEALKLALGYAPWRYSQALVEEHDPVRIATTKDRAAGYRLVVGVRVSPRR